MMIRVARLTFLLLTFASPLLAQSMTASAQTSPVTTAGAGTGNRILDRERLLNAQAWWDNRDWDWYGERIPFFESPDADIDATYYYRWEVVTKHLVYGSSATGYTFTEFIDRPSWSGTYGAISCPLGHQHYEVRWLKDRRVIHDFARYWFETPGAQPRSYSNWYGDAMWATYLVLQDTALLRTVLPHMETQYAGWMRERWDSAHAMFVWDGMHDGMETNINSRQTTNTFSGAPGYRPTLNSYLYADARAIAKAAALFGDSGKAKLYDGRADQLKQRVQQELWDPKRNFFFHQFSQDEQDGVKAKSLTHQTGKYAGSPHGRELIGYVPWQFNLPDPGYEGAWRYLMDPQYFQAKYGPLTTERNDPLFKISPRCCEWSGNSWPYATTQTLVAMANLLNDYRQDVISARDYFDVLKGYTLFQRLDGRPYVAEAGHPDTGSWDGHNHYYHSEHYFHSGYVDLIITGLVGLRPRADDVIEINPLVPRDWKYFALDDVSYHGHSLSVLWDRDGSRYGRGRGLSIVLDGRVIANARTLQRLTARIPGPAAHSPSLPPARPHNIAVNNGRSAYPQITASYSAPQSPYTWANDGHIWYHASPPNRWSTLGSRNPQEWIEIDFGAERSFDSVKLYFVEDSVGVKPPAAYALESWREGGWQPLREVSRAPAQPQARRANTVTLASGTRAGRVRVRLTPQAGQAVGLSELEVWSGDTPVAPARNLALNASGSGFPQVTASQQPRAAAQMNDGIVLFPSNGRNRWAAAQSPNATDTVEVNFGRVEQVGVVELFLWGDDRTIRAPSAYVLEYFDGSAWQRAKERARAPVQPLASALNLVQLEPVRTPRLRVLFTHSPGSFTGVTEIVVRGPEE